MSDSQDDSIFLEFLPVLPPDNNEAELITNRYYYLLSSPNLSEYSNAWKYLANKDADPLAKWLEVGQPTYYNEYPFSVSILSKTNVVEKNEKVREGNKDLISSTDTSLLDTYNSFLRVMLAGDYPTDAKYTDLKLQISETLINHFAIENPLNGLIRDLTENQDGQLIDSNCLSITDFANTKIRLPEIIDIDNSTLSKNVLATAAITASANEITFTANGTLFQLEFNDTDGNSYEFPLCDRWIGQDSVDNYLLHGIKYEVGSGAKTHIYAWYNGAFTHQDIFHWMAVYGADLNTNQADTSQKIWTPKDRDKEIMYSLGVDDDFYLVDLLPIV